VAYVRTTGIVLRCTDYSESSQVAALLTPDMGQVHVLAKGSRRPRKDGSVPLDLLNHCDFVIARKGAGQLHILAEYQTTENFPGIHGDLRRIAAALYADELCLAFTSENAEDGPLFGLLLELLRGLNRGEERDWRLLQFVARALEALGSGPAAEHCAHCGGPLQGAPRFAPAAGGALCGACSAVYPASFPVSRGALAIMSRLATREGPSQASVRMSEQQIREIRRAFGEQMQYHLGRPLKTERLTWKELAAPHCTMPGKR